MIEYSGAGALAVLVMAFVAGVGWRHQGWTDDQNEVSKYLGQLWIVFQPILFGLIGTEIKVNQSNRCFELIRLKTFNFTG